MPDFSKMNPEDLEQMARDMREAAAGVPVEKIDPVAVSLNPPTTPSPAPPQDPYDWSDLAGFNFTTPSGRQCYMRSLGVKDVAAAGILSQVSRLEALADKLVQQGNGTPPKISNEEMSDGDVTALSDLLEKCIPLAVIKPTVWPVPDPEDKDPEKREKVVGRVYVDTIPIGDQVAIVERALGELSKFDSFRK